jgi:hypothetical protein
MITKSEFKENNTYIYSDFGDKSYLYIKALNIYKTHGDHFWFNAKVVDNSQVNDKKFNAIGTVHSYSNSFIYKNLKDLKQDTKLYKQTQTNFIKKAFIKIKQNEK